MGQDVDRFIEMLALAPAMDTVFNPWRNYDPTYDRSIKVPALRCSNLRAYLNARVKKAKYILVAEAVGYQGGKFSGVPMTSERMLLANHPTVDSNHIVPNHTFQRSSKPESCSGKTVATLGYAEPTATIVWETLLSLPISPFSVILWNIFPFHPYKAEKGALSNRTPLQSELTIGLNYLNNLKSICPKLEKVVAIGRKSAKTIDTLEAVVHPANGRARQFQDRLPKLLLA